jgi:hypothetical protein
MVLSRANRRNRSFNDTAEGEEYRGARKPQSFPDTKSYLMELPAYWLSMGAGTGRASPPSS